MSENSSFEEDFISYCEKYKIEYEQEYVIDELPHRFYDFYLPEHNTLVELDGRQHFEFVSVFHHYPRGLIKTKNVDILKTEVAIRAGYKIIRIDYTKKDKFHGFMYRALHSKREKVYSTPNMYKHLYRKIPKKYQDECTIDLEL